MAKKTSSSSNSAQIGKALEVLGVVLGVVVLTWVGRDGFWQLSVIGCIATIAAGIVVLVWPELTRWILGLYLAAVAVIAILGLPLHLW